MDIKKSLNDDPFSGKVIWLDSIYYIKQMFARNSNELWVDAPTYISVVSQGQNLLQSDVLHINTNDFYSVALNQTIAESFKGNKPKRVLKKLLALEEPIDLIKEIIIGLNTLYQKSKPIILQIDSPVEWLRLAYNLTNKEINYNNDEIDAASMYLAEYLQNFSKSGISGIALKEKKVTKNKFDYLFYYQPVINLAKHYQWVIGLRFENVSFDIVKKEEFNFMLFPETSMSDMLPFWEKETPFFGGLNKTFWSKQYDSIHQEKIGPLFGEVPVDAHPEVIPSQLQLLRSIK